MYRLNGNKLWFLKQILWFEWFYFNKEIRGNFKGCQNFAITFNLYLKLCNWE